MRCRLSTCQQAFTIVELIVVVAILGILALMSIPMLTQYVNKAKSGSSAAEIRTIEKDITAYTIDKNTLPPTLLDAGFSKTDPWGHPYIYVVGNPPPLQDSFGFPLNSDYDLYSSGADGASDPVVANPVTQDDIVRSNDGGFAGSRAGL